MALSAGAIAAISVIVIAAIGGIVAGIVIALTSSSSTHTPPLVTFTPPHPSSTVQPVPPEDWIGFPEFQNVNRTIQTEFSGVLGAQWDSARLSGTVWSMTTDKITNQFLEADNAAADITVRTQRHVLEATGSETTGAARGTCIQSFETNIPYDLVASVINYAKGTTLDSPAVDLYYRTEDFSWTSLSTYVVNYDRHYYATGAACFSQTRQGRTLLCFPIEREDGQSAVQILSPLLDGSNIPSWDTDFSQLLIVEHTYIMSITSAQDRLAVYIFPQTEGGFARIRVYRYSGLTFVEEPSADIDVTLDTVTSNPGTNFLNKYWINFGDEDHLVYLTGATLVYATWDVNKYITRQTILLSDIGVTGDYKPIQVQLTETNEVISLTAFDGQREKFIILALNQAGTAFGTGEGEYQVFIHTRSSTSQAVAMDINRDTGLGHMLLPNSDGNFYQYKWVLGDQ